MSDKEEIKKLQKIILEYIEPMGEPTNPFRTGIPTRKIHLISEAIHLYQKQTIDKLKEQLKEWKDAKESLPICFEKGDWDGERSDWYLVETEQGHEIAILYSGKMDGTEFNDWYTESDYEIEVIRWMEIPNNY